MENSLIANEIEDDALLQRQLQAKLRAQVEANCRAIPSGQTLSYGELGAKCEPPISGYVCGRIMATLMDDAPWWRVVAKDGRLPISKRSPTQAVKQRELLEREGVQFLEGKVVRQQQDEKEQADELKLEF